MQLWRGVIVSTNPDAKRRTGLVPNKPKTTTKQARCRCITSKEAGQLNTTDFDKAKHCTAAMSLFENLSSTKGKW